MPETMHDHCSLTLVQRLAATLGQDPAALREGSRLPRGWHVAFFNPATPQPELRPDGLAGLGAELPKLGLPRVMAAGRRLTWLADIPIGAALRRDSRQAGVVEKQGRSGRFALVTIEHRIFAGGGLALVEEQDYVMRGPESAPTPPPPPLPRPVPTAERLLVADETLLMRYSAITFNAHRIHYDLPYATGAEGYPALVVNGGIPVLALLELFREVAGREPDRASARNMAPLFCGQPIRLLAAPEGAGWQLWAEDSVGRVAVGMTVS